MSPPRSSWPPAPGRGGSPLELAAALAHDLRSPVASIQLLAEGLQHGAAGPVNAMQRRQLALIRSAAFSLCVLATDVEELAREGHNPLDAKMAPFSISGVLADLQKVVAPLQESKGIALHFDAPARMVDHRLGHPGALSRILLNLTMNALQATDYGSVSVAARPCGQRRVEFSVTDSGPGFDSDALPAGLGLKICRDLIEALGSTLDLTSQVGTGTRFCFTIDLPPALPIR